MSDDKRHLIVAAKLGRYIKIKLHRPLEGKPKVAHLILRADKHWCALIVCEMEQPTNDEYIHFDASTCEHPDIGLDVALKVFLADSEGQTIGNPKYYRKRQKVLRRKQRTQNRRKKGSHHRRKATRSVAQTHLKITRQRRDFHFKTAKYYAERYRTICVEDLNIAGMVQNHSLAKSIFDAGWGSFVRILSDKAASAGHRVVRVPPQYTTQACSKCGKLVPKSLSVRVHCCIDCGSTADRDVNAAQNILRAGARPSGTLVVGLADEPRISLPR